MVFRLESSSIPLHTGTIVLFIQSSVLRYLGCSQIQAIVNHAAINTGVQMSFLSRLLGPWDRGHRAESLGYMEAQFIGFFGKVSVLFLQNLSSFHMLISLLFLVQEIDYREKRNERYRLSP